MIVFHICDKIGGSKTIRWAGVPIAWIAPIPVSDTPLPIQTVVPGKIVNVCPLGTVQLAAMMYGLPAGDQVLVMMLGPEITVCATVGLLRKPNAMRRPEVTR